MIKHFNDLIKDTINNKLINYNDKLACFCNWKATETLPFRPQDQSTYWAGCT